MIRTQTAQKICNSWHGGQWSALYSFASTSFFYPEKSISYLWEIMQTLQNEHFAAYPKPLNKTENRELTQLKEYFEGQILANTGKVVEYKKHPDYGYLFPVLEGFSINLPI